MKKLFASFLLISSTLASAQELHTFSNGEVADAEKINENFRILEEEFGLLSSAIPSGIGAVFDEEGYAVVSVDCTSNTDAFADAAEENRRVSKVHFKVSGSCAGYINLTNQVIIISGTDTDGACSTPAELSGLRVRQGVALINCADVDFFQVYGWATVRAIDVSVEGLFVINAALSFSPAFRQLVSMGNPLVVGHSTLSIQGGYELTPLKIPGRLDVADSSTVVFSNVNFLDPTEVWAYRSSSFRCEACTGEISDFYLDRDSWAILGVSPQDLEVKQLTLGPDTSLTYSDTVNIGAVTKLEFTSSSTPNSISNALSGCSAAQDGSSVVITCADGTSGVLASEGTVVLIPEGDVAITAPDTYNTGQIVVMDANDSIVAPALASEISATNFFQIELATSSDTFRTYLRASDEDDSVTLVPYNAGTVVSASRLLFKSDNCSGQPFIYASAEQARWALAKTSESEFFVKKPDAESEELLFGSRIVSEHVDYNSYYVLASSCESGDFIRTAYLAAPFEVPTSISDAMFPIRLEQLP